MEVGAQQNHRVGIRPVGGAPDRLCVDEDRLEPEARLRELERERDDRLFDFFEELPPERLLLLDRDFCWGILPSPPEAG